MKYTMTCSNCDCHFDLKDFPKISTTHECPNCAHKIIVRVPSNSDTTQTVKSIGIKFIEVLINLPGTDKISLHTTLPSPFPPGISNDHLVLNAEVQRGKGIEYVVEHFYPILLIIIDTNTGRKLQINEDGELKIIKRTI